MKIRRLLPVFFVLVSTWPACTGDQPANYLVWPTNSAGYVVESLPVLLTASYARGDDVYLGEASGEIAKVRDSDLGVPWVSLGKPAEGGPKLLFASSAGVVFASTFGGPVYRTVDSGQTWTLSLDVPCWRMDEDDQGSLFIGNYTKHGVRPASVFKSVDGGASWAEVYRRTDSDHIHTVRWDKINGRLYIAYGDQPARGQAYSDDRGATFHVIAEGPREGDTDVAATTNDVFWCSDDQSGSVLRTRRRDGESETPLAASGFVWFGVARGRQVYLGTVSSKAGGGDRAVLLASDDEGATWTKLMETGVSKGPYNEVFGAESRELSAGGWLYFTGDTADGPKSYRVRKQPG